MAIKSKQEIYISFILDLLIKGITERRELYAIFYKKFPKCDKTFATSYKVAQKRHLEAAEAIESKKIAMYEDDEIKALQSQIITKMESLVIASKIAKGTATKVDDRVMVPSPRDRIAAMQYISDLEGWNAPKKIDHTTQGEKLNLPPYMINEINGES